MTGPPRTYSEAEVKELQRAWKADQQQSQLVQQIVKLEGRFDALPAQMETVAKRVVSEVLAEQRAQDAEGRSEQSQQRWTRIPALLQAFYFAAAIGFSLLSYLAGRGLIP